MNSIENVRKNLLDKLNIEIDFNNKNIAIYGAGNSSKLAELSLIEEKIEPKFYIDNNLKDGGEKII